MHEDLPDLTNCLRHHIVNIAGHDRADEVGVDIDIRIDRCLGRDRRQRFRHDAVLRLHDPKDHQHRDHQQQKDQEDHTERKSLFFFTCHKQCLSYICSAEVNAHLVNRC